ncbi:MAG: hypothetical protein V9G15_13355 [Dermatophilaceae bacterium]
MRTDGSRDPRVGVVGASYGGALALMLGSTDPRVDSVTAYITWNDLADAFFPQRARTGGAEAASDALPGPFKALWAARFFGSATAPARTAESPASADTPGGRTNSGTLGDPTSRDTPRGRTNSDTLDSKAPDCAAFTRVVRPV